MAGLNVGDIIKFGRYDWRVLDIQDGKALILTEKIIEKTNFHQSWVSTTWEKCTLRGYLNNEFYNTFSPPEKARISETVITNSSNPWWRHVSGGKDTSDRIFLLSIEEVVRYFGDSGQLKNRPRTGCFDNDGQFDKWIYATAIDDQYNALRKAADEADIDWWWHLRSPGQTSKSSASVGGGYLQLAGGRVDRDGGVRPALWLNLVS